MTTEPNEARRYTVTYGDPSDPSRDADVLISVVIQTVTAAQDAGIDVEFLGGRLEIDPRGDPTEVTIQYRAQTKGIIGYLNWRAGLPANGPPRRETLDRTDAIGERVAMAGR